MRTVGFAFLLAWTVACMSAEQAWAWGQEGHSIVAEIAQRRLDAGTLEKIKTLLKDEAPEVEAPQVALASIASWADDYRAKHEQSTNWHFVDIPYERNTYDPAVDCKRDPKFGDCIINAIERSRATIADCSKPPKERAEALKFLVHFVGDIHQPLHAAERNNDHGGNDVQVTFFGKSMKLHALWDTGLIMHTVYAWGTYVERLETSWFRGRDLTGLDGGTPVDWALESHELAREFAYNIPDGSVLADNYYRDVLPVVDRQLALGGVRLARLLKSTLPTCR
jgi:hypothetical protein